MATDALLLAAIRDVLGRAASVNYNNPAASNDLYECYVWTLCLDAARKQGADIRFENVHGATTDSLVFRTAPGEIYSRQHPYAHAVITFAQLPPLELHIGVRVTGKSQVRHECDVAVLDQAEASMCRSRRVHPRASKVLIAAECKFYTSAIQLHLGRGFLGLTSEIHKRARYFVTNSTSASVGRLIAHYDTEWDDQVVPRSQAADSLRHSFMRVFRRYVNTNG